MTGIVIVGAGHAGGRAALALREAGYPGAVTLVGEEPHPPYERPPLSKALLTGEMEAGQTYLKPAAAYAQAGIDLRLSARVETIDRAARQVLLQSGEAIPYEKLLLTTGARPRELLLEGPRCSHVVYLRDQADAALIRDRLAPGVQLVVVGAGLIGLEIAATASGRGCEVTVLEAGPTPLMRVVAPEIGAWFAGQHRSHGVHIVTGASVTQIGDRAGGARLQLADGSEMDADLVVVGIGAKPNDDLARQAGLNVEDGVLVNEYGRTSDPHIFAAGDVARAFNPLLGRHQRLETWLNAQDQPVAVAKVMAGGSEAYAEVPWFWTDQYGFNMQMAGLPEAWDELVWRGGPHDERFTVHYLKDGRVVAAAALNNARDIRDATELIRSGEPADRAALASAPVAHTAEQAVAAHTGWTKVAEVSDVPPGEIKGVQVGEQRVAIYNLDGRFYATDNVCTHAFALLSDGWLEGEYVECPLHAGRFEIATGKAMGDPVECDLKTFAVRVSGDHLEVLIEG